MQTGVEVGEGWHAVGVLNTRKSSVWLALRKKLAWLMPLTAGDLADVQLTDAERGMLVALKCAEDAKTQVAYYESLAESFKQRIARLGGVA